MKIWIMLAVVLIAGCAHAVPDDLPTDDRSQFFNTPSSGNYAYVLAFITDDVVITQAADCEFEVSFDLQISSEWTAAKDSDFDGTPRIQVTMTNPEPTTGALVNEFDNPEAKDDIILFDESFDTLLAKGPAIADDDGGFSYLDTTTKTYRLTGFKSCRDFYFLGDIVKFKIIGKNVGGFINPNDASLFSSNYQIITDENNKITTVVRMGGGGF